MQFCPTDWDALNNAIKLRGLWDFQTKTTEDAEMLVRSINGEPQAGDDPDLFDSILTAQCLIFQHALDIGGVYLVFGDEKGEPFCPLCECRKNTKHDPQQWIDAACDEVVQRARAQGLFVVETKQ